MKYPDRDRKAREKEIKVIKKLKEIKFECDEIKEDYIHFNLSYTLKTKSELIEDDANYCLYFNMYHNCFVILLCDLWEDIANQLLIRWLQLQGINNKHKTCIKMGKIKRGVGLELFVEEYVQLLALLKLKNIKTWA